MSDRTQLAIGRNSISVPRLTKRAIEAGIATALTAFVALDHSRLEQRVDRTRRLDRRPRRLVVIHSQAGDPWHNVFDGSRDGDVPLLAARPGHQALTSLNFAGGQLSPGNQ